MEKKQQMELLSNKQDLWLHVLAFYGVHGLKTESTNVLIFNFQTLCHFLKSMVFVKKKRKTCFVYFCIFL